MPATVAAQRSFSLFTNTATVCVFDPAGLRHKLADDCDWWSIASAELAAVNAGQAAFFNLGSDGVYDVALHGALAEAQASVQIAVVSGRIYIGAGEDVSGAGLEPDAACGGLFLDLPAGNYCVQARRDCARISLALLPSNGCGNAFDALVRL